MIEAIVLFCISFVAIALVVTLWIAYKGIPMHDDSFSHILNGLLECSTEAPYVVIQRVFRKEFIQLYREKSRTGKMTLRMAFPIAERSRVSADPATYNGRAWPGVGFLPGIGVNCVQQCQPRGGEMPKIGVTADSPAGH